MNAEERLLEYGYDDVIIFKDYSYDDALIGISDDDRAIYDYGKMIEWLIEEDWSYDVASDWVNYNTIRAIPYIGNRAPIIMYSLPF